MNPRRGLGSQARVHSPSNHQAESTRMARTTLTSRLTAARLAAVARRGIRGGDPAGGVAATSSRLGAAVSLLVSIVLAILVLSAWWFDGLWTRAWLSNLRLGFMVYMNLLVMYAVCFAAWLAPLAVWAGRSVGSKQ